jgi:proteasomal ATPase-associated factor 1
MPGSSSTLSLPYHPSIPLSWLQLNFHIPLLDPSHSGSSQNLTQVLSHHFYALGRNMFFASLDTMVKLWDVPSCKYISFLLSHSPIFSSGVSERAPAPPGGEEFVPHTKAPKDEREVPEFEMQSKLVFCGLQNGTFELFDLRDKASVYCYPAPSASAGSLTSININAHNFLTTGSSKGIFSVYDMHVLWTEAGVPVTTFKRNEAVIEDPDFVMRGTSRAAEVGLGIATVDGLPYIVDIVPEEPAVSMELVDEECNPVWCLKVRERRRGENTRSLECSGQHSC